MGSIVLAGHPEDVGEVGAGGLVDDRLDGNLRGSKMPVGITGNPQFYLGGLFHDWLGNQAKRGDQDGQSQSRFQEIASFKRSHA